MAVPKRKHSKQRKNIRRGAISLILTKVVKCKNCGKTKLPHRLCNACKK